MRMDRYKDFDEKTKLQEEEKEEVLSRQEKNQDMYTDVYMNNTFVDINNIFPKDEEDVKEKKEVIYKEEKYFCFFLLIMIESCEENRFCYFCFFSCTTLVFKIKSSFGCAFLKVFKINSTFSNST